MSDYVPNITNVNNLFFDWKNPGFEKSVVINRPDIELDLLKQFAALDQDSGKISTDDYKANPEKAQKLLNQLEGLYLYWNDNCPWHQSLVTFYDLGSAMLFLSKIKDNIGERNFKNSVVIFEEQLLGLDFTKIPEFKNITFAPNEPPHHVITRAYNIIKGTDSYNIPAALPKSAKVNTTQLKNLQLYENSNVLISHVIKNPARELQILIEIANLDGNISNISDKDMQNKLFESKLKQLEGYQLYVNDQQKDSTLEDLNISYEMLKIAQKRGYDLSNINFSLEEKFSPENNHRSIETGRVVLNKDSDNFVEIKNFIK